jgi:hypothetical protein
MKCQCCNQDRARLTAVPSELIANNKLMLCSDCRRQGHEPRYFVILAAQSGKQVRDYVKLVRYCGASLEAHEVLV